MRRKRWILSCAIAAGIAWLVIWLLRPSPPDPIQNGKRASEWAQDLREEDEQKRQGGRAASKQLGARAVPALRAVLRKQDWPGQEIINEYGRRWGLGKIRLRSTASARECAASLLSGLGPRAEEAIPELTQALGESSANVSVEAEHALRSIGLAAAKPVARVLDGGNEKARVAAARVLSELEGAGDDAFWPLVKALDDQSPEVRAAAALALGSIKVRRPAGVTALSDRLTDVSAGVRRSCAEALGKNGILSRPAAAKLRDALQDSASEVRFHAAKALWLIERRAEPVLPTLIDCLGRAQGWQAAYVLAEMGTNAIPAIPALITALKKETVPRPIRTPPSASSALGQIGAAAIPALTKIAHHSDARVRLHAALAISMMGAEARGARTALLSWLADSEPNVREVSALCLGAIDPQNPKVLPALVECLHAEDIYVRSAAVDRLRQIAPEMDWVAQAD